MGNETEKTCKREQMANEGTFAENFTQNGWFCKIKPAFGIAKVKFSFVKKGTHSKESFDVYMDIEDMILWSEDIKNKDFFRILEAEAKAGEKFPKYYKFETGEKASKSVGFMMSSNGADYVINGKIYQNEKNIYANVPVNRSWVRKLAFWFDNCLRVSNWVDNMATKTVAASTRYHDSFSREDEETISPSAESEQPEQPKQSSATNTATGNTQARKPYSVSSNEKEPDRNPEPEQNEQQNPENEDAPAESENRGQIKTFKVKVIQSFVDMQNGGKAMNVCKENGERIPVIIPKDMIGKEGWTEFSGMCSVPGARITIKGCISSGRIILNSFTA